MGLLFAAVQIVSVNAAAQAHSDEVADTPANHWIYEAVADLKRGPLKIMMYVELVRSDRPYSRYEVAVYAHAGCVRFHSLVGDMVSENQMAALSRAVVGTESIDAGKRSAMLQSSNHLIPLLRRFSGELTELGVDPGEIAAQVKRDQALIVSFRPSKTGEALVQFPDVPTSHWASDAVENLRANGILQGYPDGRFRG